MSNTGSVCCKIFFWLNIRTCVPPLIWVKKNKNMYLCTPIDIVSFFIWLNIHTCVPPLIWVEKKQQKYVPVYLYWYGFIFYFFLRLASCVFWRQIGFLRKRRSVCGFWRQFLVYTLLSLISGIENFVCLWWLGHDFRRFCFVSLYRNVS